MLAQTRRPHHRRQRRDRPRPDRAPRRRRRPADHHARPVPARPRTRRAVRHQFVGSILDTHLLERILAEYEVDRVFHLAALLSTRSEFTPDTAHQVNVEGTLNTAGVRPEARASRTAGRSCSCTRRSPPTACPTWTTRRGPGRVSEDDFNHADHDVRLQQALLRAPRPLLRAALQAARRGHARRQGRLPLHPLPGPDLAVTMPSGGTSDYAPEMIHAAAAGQALRLLRPARHAHPVHGHAGRRRGPPAAGGRRRARS